MGCYTFQIKDLSRPTLRIAIRCWLCVCVFFWFEWTGWKYMYINIKLCASIWAKNDSIVSNKCRKRKSVFQRLYFRIGEKKTQWKKTYTLTRGLETKERENTSSRIEGKVVLVFRFVTQRYKRIYRLTEQFVSCTERTNKESTVTLLHNLYYVICTP